MGKVKTGALDENVFSEKLYCLKSTTINAPFIAASLVKNIVSIQERPLFKL